MGFLRKVGKKIKNGISKLLDGKFGKILGGIGLAMMFWGGASALFGNQGWFQGLKTNLAKMNPFGSQSVTQASEVAINSLPETTTGIDKLVGAGTDAAAQASAVSVDPTKFEKFLAGDLSKVEALDTAKFSELDFGSKIAKVGVETGKGFYKAGESIGGYLKGIPEGDFIPDVLTGATTALVTSSVLGGDEQDTGGYGRIPQVGSMEAPQASYVSEVQSQIPQMQGMNFNQLNQSLFYGTLSPQWLMSQAQYG